MNSAVHNLTAPNLAAGLLSGVSGVHRALVKTTEAGIVAGLGLLDPSLAPAPVGQWNLRVREGAAVGLPAQSRVRHDRLRYPHLRWRQRRGPLRDHPMVRC